MNVIKLNEQFNKELQLITDEKAYNKKRREIMAWQRRVNFAQILKHKDLYEQYLAMSDVELLALHEQLLNDVKPIPVVLVYVLNSRKLVENYRGTFNSDMG